MGASDRYGVSNLGAKGNNGVGSLVDPGLDESDGTECVVLVDSWQDRERE